MAGSHEGLVPVEVPYERAGVQVVGTVWKRPEEARAMLQEQKARETDVLAKLSAAKAPKGAEKPSAEAVEKWRAHVEEKTPRPPEGAPWKGPADPKEPDDETWGKYMTGKPGDPTARVTDPERAALHEAIKEHFLGKAESVPEGKAPVAIMMMGGPASGKSSMIRDLDETKFARIDPDGIKEKMPEYRAGVSEKRTTAAMNVHEESSHLAKQIRAEAVAQRKNILLDGTGSDVEKWVGTMKQLQDAGYHVKLMACHVPKEVAAERAAARAEKTGRRVPQHAIDYSYARIPRNIEKAALAANSFEMWENSGAKARVVWSGGGGQSTEHDPDFMREFRATYGGKRS